MPDPVIARPKPYYEEVKQGKTYHWCRCGRSARQPFCDGSHQGTGFEPLRYVAQKDAEVLFCGCKRSAKAPICDGTHNSLGDKYGAAEPADGVGARLVEAAWNAAGTAAKAELDNHCFVLSPALDALPAEDGFTLTPVISAADGARFLSQYLAVAGQGGSPVLRYPGSDVVLFVLAGRGTVTVSGRAFDVGPETGVYVKPEEAFAVCGDGAAPLVLLISVCPQCQAPTRLAAMPDNFDADQPIRAVGVDPDKREAMADRFFQVLVDEAVGSRQVTQFIGEIPCSRAPHHRHLYEEALAVLKGEGFMWTDRTKAPMKPGDIVFLPRKQAHSVECTSPGGMRLMGLFYPAGSPAINY